MESDNTTIVDKIPEKVSESSLTPRPEAPGLEATIVLHDRGDATLILGDDADTRQPVLVSKTAMCLASSVWKAMFEPHWRENEATEIPLPDDDIEATLIALRIAHLRFHELPKEHGLTIETLHALAMVCDKYDLVRLVRPFLDLHEWSECHFPLKKKRARYHPNWLFFAWTFGYKDSFIAFEKYITQRIGLDAHGNAVTDDCYGFPDHFPPDLLERMMHIRNTVLTAMLDELYKALDRIIEGPVCCSKSNYEKKCRSMVLGSYVSFLLENNLYPKRCTPTETSLSIKRLSNLVADSEIAIYESAYEPSHKHISCSQVFDFKSTIKKHFSDIGSAVLDSHLRHMEKQATK
ncbi:hypothetical protein BDW02DRAFT_535226 [Decorospora gaudefroyi]|uniref:BTB domain-containing protein n=1 Tax=Decorospora gaudefroyi TaxID=184978 RepID=A0A6A5K583_9PLEO|nr:hypothetical protein BDW02DRAFT_535226 [Decorospora gaudefroyi]